MNASKTPSQRLAIDEDLTIYNANAHKALLLDALAAAEHLELDLSRVAEIDTAGLQLLMLVKREALQHGKNVSISGHSAAVQQVLDFCNLVGAFGDPMVISAHA